MLHWIFANSRSRIRQAREANGRARLRTLERPSAGDRLFDPTDRRPLRCRSDFDRE